MSARQPRRRSTSDITRILNEWPYRPGQVSARLIDGDDGEPRLQVRLDLGLLQMHLDGRPDGQEPNGFPSLLDYYESREEEDAAEDEVEDKSPEGTALDRAECQELREEALQYYHRYVALLALQDFERVVRDTTRNLRVIDLCARNAEHEDDRSALEQFRPYILMMRTRALASLAMKDQEPKAALFAIDEGIETLRRYFDSVGGSGISGSASGRGSGGGAGSTGSGSTGTGGPGGASGAGGSGSSGTHGVSGASGGAPTGTGGSGGGSGAGGSLDQGGSGRSGATSRSGGGGLSGNDLFENSEEVLVLRNMREMLSPHAPMSQRGELEQRLKLALERENYELAAILRDELAALASAEGRPPKGTKSASGEDDLAESSPDDKPTA
ncbi:MAG: UvrB/UvrC motif-containing protein [Planctomycetota bacterium]|nr:UvrB/UvrC motif-containing protein [Planctomycetota bacterium]